VSEDLAVIESSALAPMPMGESFRRYRVLQADIDAAMPDCIIQIGTKKYRTKGFWRAVGVAFNLKVECVSEERIEQEGDWGYKVMYRATAKNGMVADGDGMCMASEKPERQRSEHNVRSHGHTRGYNRAISNLVGFGEVSAEEIPRDEHPRVASVAPKPHYAPSTAAAVPGQVADGDYIPFDEPEDNTPIPPAIPEGFVTVTMVEEKTGTSAKGPWTMTIVRFSDGREGSTFDGPLSVTAKAAMASKTPVIPTLTPSGKGNNRFNLTAIVRA